MAALPGWLMARARTGGFTRVHVLLPPAGARSSAVYLLESAASPEARFELHAVDDAEVGIDGCTIALQRGEAYKLLSAMAGAFTGRTPGEEVVPLGVTAMAVTLEHEAGYASPQEAQIAARRAKESESMS